MRSGKHGIDDLTFEELDFKRQAQSISGQIRTLENSITAHQRRAHEEGRDTTEILGRELEQITRLLRRIEGNEG
jgi:hypothetical protein